MQPRTKRQMPWILLGLLVIPLMAVFVPYKLPTIMIGLAKFAIAVPLTAAAAWTLDKAFDVIEIRGFMDLALIYVGTCILLGATL